MKDVENKKLNKFFAALWNWAKDNRYFLMFLLFSAIMEMTTVFLLEGNPFMSRPFLSWGLLMFISGLVLLVPSRRGQVGIFSILLVVQFALQLIFSVIFDLTEQYFEYEMLNLKNDAFGTLENIPIRFWLFFVGITLCISYVVVGLRGTKQRPKFKANKRSVFTKLGAALVGIATIFISFFCYYPRNLNRYEDMINGTTNSSYSAYGVTGNLLGEFIGAMFPDKSTMRDDDIEKFIYDENAVWTGSEYFGVSKNNNVITILGETLEWFSFMTNDSKHVNTLGLTDDEMASLFPNMRRFMDKSLKMTNFHSREKTDIAETLSIMGSYPTTAYINYDYYSNTMPLTISNVLKMVDEDIQCRSFHNGFKTFYNRDDVHRAFGFESLTDMYDMARMAKEDYDAEKKANEGNPDWHGTLSFQNYMKKGERNLDSEMVEVCKDEMFPTDKRFYTYITTITMHGIYYDRDNLDRWDKMLEAALGEERIPNPDDDDLKDDLLYHYLTAAMEFDYAIGKMMDELETRGLLDNTTIVIFGDHNAYYHSLSKYVKDIYDYETERRYTDLYNVPMLVYDKNVTGVSWADDKVTDMTVDKFTCTADIASTILDLLGISYYENMYYGTSVFQEKGSAVNKESVLYSRAYDTFIASGIVGRSVNNLLYQHPNADVDTYKETAIELVEKIKYCDYIYKQNYFGSKENWEQYRNNFMELQRLYGKKDV